jgi:hypothetical protein
MQKQAKKNERRHYYGRRYKILTPAPPRPGEKGYDVPLLAIELGNDIERLDIAVKLLKEIDSMNIADVPSHEAGDLLKWNTISAIKGWRAYAASKLKRYLAP